MQRWRCDRAGRLSRVPQRRRAGRDARLDRSAAGATRPSRGRRRQPQAALRERAYPICRHGGWPAATDGNDIPRLSPQYRDPFQPGAIDPRRRPAVRRVLRDAGQPVSGAWRMGCAERRHRAFRRRSQPADARGRIPAGLHAACRADPYRPRVDRRGDRGRSRPAAGIALEKARPTSSCSSAFRR